MKGISCSLALVLLGGLVAAEEQQSDLELSTVVIKAKGQVSRGKRGRLEPKLQLECSYEIAGKKGKLTTYPLAARGN